MKCFVSFANSTVTAFRLYNTDDELYGYIKDCANFSKYMIAIDNGKVVYEFKNGVNAPITKRAQFNPCEIRKVTDIDMKRARYAYSRRLVNCDVTKFGQMMTEAEKSGVV